jgi:hypothetical protein
VTKPDPVETIINELPSSIALSVIGGINIAWAQLDTLLSTALFGLLEIDPIEFSIIVGRLDIQTKATKIREILDHRNTEQSGKQLIVVKALLAELHKWRPDRNAIIHGYYVGRTQKHEYHFASLADPLTSDTGSHFKLFVYTLLELGKHLEAVSALLLSFLNDFDGNHARMHTLLNVPMRVPSYAQVRTANPDSSRKKRQRRR